MKKLQALLILCALALTATMTTSCENNDDVDDGGGEVVLREYAITVAAGPGGRAEATVKDVVAAKAAEGAWVTLTATPDEGYVFGSWTVRSGDLKLSGNPVTFTMPAKEVSVEAEFVEEEIDVFDKIEDPIFLYYCKEIGKFDTDGNGKLSLEEAQAVTEINVNEMYKLLGERVQSMAGIEYFTSLRLLTCYGNSIGELDVSKNTELEHLHVGTNNLLALDVSKNTKLSELFISRNAISKIDLSACPALQKFGCDQCNMLSSLDFSNNPELREVSVIECSNITQLDFSSNPKLTILWCSSGNLTALDVSKCTALEALNCYYNRLTTLDVSNCTALTVLSCQGNQLTALDVSKATSLQNLMCYNNRMTTLDATAMASPNDYDLGCGLQTTDGTTPQTLTLTLRDEQKAHWQYELADFTAINDNVVLAGESADIFGSITDPIFKSFCEQYDTDHDGKLTQEEASVVTEMVVSNLGIASLEGVEYFAGLTRLVCDHNKLTKLSALNPELVELICSDNLLTELTVWKTIRDGQKITSIDCQNNKLTYLSVSGCPELVTLNCQNNELTGLNLNYTVSLQKLNCSNNKLTSLDFYRIHNLLMLTCPNNQLTTLYLSGKSTLQSLICNDNPMTKLDISGCTSLVGVMAFGNRLSELDASDMANPASFNLFCGSQTSDGATPRTLTLTLRPEQIPHWEEGLKSIPMNDNVVLAQ